ncbi:hypothetical protein ACGF3J_13345 [Streptomyces sp. NPDC048171]|nr:hypothetical protein [Streptomyces sp. SID5789]
MDGPRDAPVLLVSDPRAPLREAVAATEVKDLLLGLAGLTGT